MSKYFWDENSILQDRNLIVDMINSETDVRKKYELMKVISFLDNYHFINNTEAPLPHYNLGDKIYFVASERSFYQIPYFMIHEFYGNLLPLKDKFESISAKLETVLGDDDDFTKKLGITISDDSALTYLDEFYKSFDKELYEYFKKSFDARNSQLRFSSNNNHKSSDLECDGYCLYVGGLDKNYISVKNENGPSKFFNLVHEYGHSIYNLMNPMACYEEKEIFFAEVQSMFPEMVAMYENPVGFPNIEVEHLLFSNLITNFESANYITTHDIIINEWENNNYKYNMALLLKLISNYGIKKPNIINALRHSVTESGSYILSFSVCCELLNIYKQDKEKALYIYKQILKIPTSANEFAEVQSIVKINENCPTIAKDICDRFTLSLKRL